MEIKEEIVAKFLKLVLGITDSEWERAFKLFLENQDIKKPELVAALLKLLSAKPGLIKTEQDAFRLLSRIPTKAFRELFLEKIPVKAREKLPPILNIFGPQGEGVEVRSKYPEVDKILKG